MITIINIDLIEDIYGKWPSFHDAEIYELKLSRSGERRDAYLELVIHVFQSTNEVDENGHYKTINNCLVTIRFEDIESLKLEGFNNQNVLWDLSIKEAQANDPVFEVILETLYGCSGEFLCKRIIVVEVKDYVN